MTEGAPNLLDGMDAGGAALYYAKRWWRMGRTPTEVQLDALKTWLDTLPELQTSTRQIYATDSLVRDYAHAAAFADVASGVLAVPLAEDLHGRSISTVVGSERETLLREFFFFFLSKVETQTAGIFVSFDLISNNY